MKAYFRASVDKGLSLADHQEKEQLLKDKAGLVDNKRVKLLIRNVFLNRIVNFHSPTPSMSCKSYSKAVKMSLSTYARSPPMSRKSPRFKLSEAIVIWG